MRLGAITAFTLALAACLFWVGVSAESSAVALLAPIAYTSTPQYEAEAWLHGGERFPAGSQVMVRESGKSRELATGFAATADPSVSFDGTKLLFAGKREAKAPWQIWEIALAGKPARQVTACSDDCVRPFYLPGMRLVYARKLDHRFVLESQSLDGGPAMRLTYAPGSALPTDVLRDGRILFETTYPTVSGTSPEIYTVYSDGSGVESYRCDHGASRQAGKQIRSGDVIFVSAEGLGRFTSPVAHAVDVKAPAGEFAGDVVETATGEYLLSWRPDTKAHYSLQLWKTGSNSLEALAAPGDTSVVQPVLIAARPVPNQHPSALHDWNYANLLCLNAYTSTHLLAPGSITSMRLYTKTTSGKPKLLGSSSVEPDGSFFVQVPPDQPLQIALLDRAGNTLKHEKAWFWMRKGEQRICVGCHAGPEHSPENVVPAVLVKSTTPVDLTGASAKSHEGGR